LFENSVTVRQISCFDIKGFKAFFKTEGDYPFDIFAASFYLLSRYEEYLPHRKDVYGRYAHENSLAFREKFLNKPLVNIWIQDLEKVLREKFAGFRGKSTSFTFVPTYDVDEAFAYIQKGFMKKIWGLARTVLKRDGAEFRNRLEVYRGQEPDPYDSFLQMDRLHGRYSLRPVFFFHVGAQRGRYDKNISPSSGVLQKLIRQLAEKYPVGIHPSWKSGDDEKLLAEEISRLSSITGKEIIASRQHYIRFTLPHTFRKLISAGITDDYSMGYGSINGFRASVSTSFYWYDLEKDGPTDLLLHPFCFMEANSFYEQKYLPQRAYEEMMHYYHTVKSVNGRLITIWHNTFLGTYPLFTGWREIYEDFIEVVTRDF
jgi:hypothetical protein